MSSEAFTQTWTGICFRMPVYKVAWASQTAQGSCCQKMPKAFNAEIFLPEAYKRWIRAVTVGYSLAGGPLLLFPSSLIGFLSSGLTGSTV